jgi:universal stress protein family protein
LTRNLRGRCTTTSEDQRGLLVPVANPEAVGGLLAIAFAAKERNDPPLRVLALVDRPHSAPAETPGGEKGAAPPTTALLAAVRYAHAKGVTIGAQVSWSDDPALDIITVAQEAGVAWILLGYHRAPSGSDAMGGVVREVFAKANALPINVGVFIQGTDRPIERVFAVVDSSPDGRASLALGVRIAQGHKCKLRALLPAKLPNVEDVLLDMVRDAHAGVGEGFHADVLTERGLRQLLKQAPGRLLIVGRKFADEVGLPLNEFPGSHRCVIVVQGADTIPSEPAPVS